jgi:hypothetical protein
MARKVPVGPHACAGARLRCRLHGARQGVVTPSILYHFLNHFLMISRFMQFVMTKTVIEHVLSCRHDIGIDDVFGRVA